MCVYRSLKHRGRQAESPHVGLDRQSVVHPVGLGRFRPFATGRYWLAWPLPPCCSVRSAATAKERLEGNPRSGRSHVACVPVTKSSCMV